MLAFCTNLLWIWRRVFQFIFGTKFESLCGLLYWNFARYAIPAHFHQRGITGDAAQPGLKSCPSLKVLHVDVGIKKTFLNRILSIITSSRDPMINTKHLIRMTHIIHVVV